MSKKITIFTTNTCAFCLMVKKYFDSKDMAYSEVNLDENPERQAEVLELSGALSVPVTVIEGADDQKEVIVGYNIPKLSAAIQ